MPSPGRVRSIVISASVCLSVCVCSLTYLKNHMAKLHRIFLAPIMIEARPTLGDVAKILHVLPALWMRHIFTWALWRVICTPERDIQDYCQIPTT